MNFQVVESFGSPEFFDMLFPLLFEACNRTNGTNSGMSTAIKTGKLYDFSFDTKIAFVRFCVEIQCLAIIRSAFSPNLMYDKHFHDLKENKMLYATFLCFISNVNWPLISLNLTP